MKYLAYYEVIEGAGWHSSTNLNKLKGEWCVSMRIFEVEAEFDYEEFKIKEKPRYPDVASKYKLIYSEGPLIFEK